jgi:hypothetical protein
LGASGVSPLKTTIWRRTSTVLFTVSGTYNV